MNLIKNLISKIMGTLDVHPFKGEVVDGKPVKPALDKIEILEALARYRNQNPTKYEAKKAALLARYGLDDINEEEVVDVEIEELKAKAKSVAKKAAKKAADETTQTDNA